MEITMKTKTIVSILFLLIVTALYLFGVCEWDLATYISCVGLTLIFMAIFIQQEKKYGALVDKKNNLEQKSNKFSGR